MKGYRNIGLFVDEVKMIEFEKKLERQHLSLGGFMNSFIESLIEEPRYQIDKELCAAARAYYKVYTGEEWQ